MRIGDSNRSPPPTINGLVCLGANVLTHESLRHNALTSGVDTALNETLYGEWVSRSPLVSY